MQIYLNGEEKQIPDASNMARLIELLDLGGQRIAVEVNEELVPRSTFDQHQLHEQDRIEIIQAVGGG
ncbi:MAG: sulfur carrier protein ThiS [Candidatus Thiodiazotropha sp.]|nr:sulfur carrier protein ThiS [Candidatus Thiodiazotropha taylori]MBT3057773.1 sulfur carrier protein ThiS [Candidatus Thiodiazotropha sp. (ex Lucina pensylvanica)]MBV2094594.1 sulfur carrier protein ThiS [Candidatus Thiodiazotropha sp. (ex Codakia orbicularis)]PUB72231.1 MAG: thiamine biosynthesis protein ThiS [gamma proteobacterium symbiont of Ctena orbiculata]MBT3061990.1 sulfur carrier protein ThiS [Candidatus Thiodiazotropha sp. (ex Lucina pensylvanica)]